MFNQQQQLFETLLGGNNVASQQHHNFPSTVNNMQNSSQFQQHQPTSSNNNSNNIITSHPTMMMNTNVHLQPSAIAANTTNTSNNNTNHSTSQISNITNESLLHQQLLYNQLVLMNQALSQNILMNMTSPSNNNNITNQQTLYNNGTTSFLPSNNPMVNSSIQPPSLLSVLSSLTATNTTTNSPQQSILSSMNNSVISTNNSVMMNTTTPLQSFPPTPNTNVNIPPSSINQFIIGTNQISSHTLHQEMEDAAKPWLFMLENMLKQRPSTQSISNNQTLSMNNLNSSSPTTTLSNNNFSSQTHHSLINASNLSTNDALSYNHSYQQPQYSGFSRESNLSPSIFQELDDIIGSIDPNVDICEKLSFEKKEEKPAFNIIVKPEEKVDTINTSLNNNDTMIPSTQVTFAEEKKKRSKRSGGGQGRGGNTGGKYLAESASKEVSPTFDYFIHSSDNSTVVVKADFEGVSLTPHERCLCALLSKAILPKDDLKSLITGPNSVTLRCIISKWLFGKLDVSTCSLEESTGSDQQTAPLSMVCDPMGFTVNKSAKPTRLSVFVNDTLKLRVKPCSFEKSSLFSADAIIADIVIFDQNMMNLFISHYSIEMRSAHYLTGLAGGLSKESDLSTTNIMNTPDICMELLSENSIVQFTEDVSKSSNKLLASNSEPFDVCVSVRRDHHYKVKLPPIKEVSMSLGFGNTSPNSALNKKISFIQVVETDSQRPVCRSEPFWCRSKSRAEMEKKQNREAMQRKTVKKDGEKKRKPKSPTDQEKKRKLEDE